MRSWPGDIDLIPCSAWSKTGDGTWVLTGGTIKLGSETMENIGVKGDAAAHKLDREAAAQEEVRESKPFLVARARAFKRANRRAG